MPVQTEGDAAVAAAECEQLRGRVAELEQHSAQLVQQLIASEGRVEPAAADQQHADQDRQQLLDSIASLQVGLDAVCAQLSVKQHRACWQSLLSHKQGQ